MMTLKSLSGSNARGIIDYLEGREIVKGEERGYYAGRGAPSAWGGSLAAELSLSGRVNGKVLQDLLEGRMPGGRTFGTDGVEKNGHRRMAVDLTFSAPKSVSEYALCKASPAMRDRILAAHDRAVARAMALAEKEFVCARYGKGGSESAKTGQSLYAAYRHEDSRPVDGKVAPQIHSHAVTLNMTKGKDGKIRAFDLQFGNDGIKLAGAVYRAELAAELRGLGFTLRKTEEGYELAGVSDEQIESGSPRRQQIDADLESKGLSRETSTGAQRTASNLSTRESKRQLSQDEQRWEWRELGREIGLDMPDPTPPQGHAPEPDAAEALTHATDHLSERESVINAQSVKLQALLHGMHTGLTIDDIDKEIAHAQSEGHLIDAGAGRCVTRETLEREASILATVSAGRGTQAPLTDEAGALARIEAREKVDGFAFSSTQRAAVVKALTTPDQHIVIRGAAGAGKSTVLAALRDEAKAHGFRVIGTGPSQTAVDGTRDANPDDARTLASFNAREEQDDMPRVILMDEAGMVSSRDMEAFLANVRPQDKVVFTGDDLQLAAVEAGSPMAQMMKEMVVEVAVIDEIVRQKDVGLLAVATAFAHGRNHEAVVLAAPYMTAITVTDKDYAVVGLKRESIKDGKEPLIPQTVRVQSIARQTADAYLQLSDAERSKTLMLAATNEMRRAINASVKAALIDRIPDDSAAPPSVTVTALDKSQCTKAQRREAINYKPEMILRVPEGRGRAKKVVDWTITASDPTRNIVTVATLDGEEKTFKPRDLNPKECGLYTARQLDLAIGDRVVFTENRRDGNYQNNETGTVVSVCADKVTIRKDDGKAVEIGTDQMHSLDHGWAVTVHRSQGRTIDRALVAGMASKMATAMLAYVACTRERFHLSIFTDNIKALQKSWARVADRETAKDATEKAARARAATPLEAARTEIRAEVAEQEKTRQEQEQAQEPEAKSEPAPVREQERGREIGDDFFR